MVLQKTIQVSALALMALGGVACGGGSSSSSSGGNTPPPVVQAPNTAPSTIPSTRAITSITPTNPVTINGQITFDHVPFNTSTSGLNYNAITQDPAPGVIVETVNSAGTIMQRSVTNSNGEYSLSVEANTDLRVRVRAEMLQTDGAQWNVRVVDNTSSGALYAIQGSLVNSGTTNSTRNLNAPSGWDGNDYNSSRAAAPFAILAPIYESIQRVVAVDPDVVLPLANFNWSVNNRPVEGNIADGEIFSSSYIGNGTILITGEANNDTDEYDQHVVIHEWGHYFEDQLSRSDSIGGEHGPGDRLDPRVALGEGFGNALSGMMTDDPIYRDSGGASQSLGFGIDVEISDFTGGGWFRERSAQSILYDIYDDDDDSSDTISAGFGPIYNVLTSNAYRNSEFFTTIFSFVEQYNAINPADAEVVNNLARAQSINGTDAAGTGETNTGTVANSLPLYKPVVVNGGAVEICTDTAQGTPNKLGNRHYLVFDVVSAGMHRLTMTRTSGDRDRDPDFTLSRAGTLLGTGFSGSDDTETTSVNLITAGQHIIDAYDFNDGDACFNFTITR